MAKVAAPIDEAAIEAAAPFDARKTVREDVAS
jgi:hypothetical protein